jgi:maltose alpha-D-glucosyltransferase/alpha-amylase
VVFPGVQKATWTRNARAGAYYFHRFYEFQPDLNTMHPQVRAEILRIMGFWLQMGVCGFRMDAVPFLISEKRPGHRPRRDYDLLHEMRQFLQWRRRDAILLAEANVPPNESMEYFGAEGDRLQMMLNFAVNQRVFYALATADVRPLVQALRDTYRRPAIAQWVNFLRSHDELDLGRLTEAQRQRVFDAFAPDPTMQLYERGIRRRMANIVNNDRARLELAYSLLFTLPGTPMLQYGDEIGLGDNLALPERECARTPMQWTSQRNGGFTRARRPVRPLVSDPIYGYKRVNVEAQRRDPNSFLNWMERKIRMRRECPEISWGDWRIIDTTEPGVLIMRYDWDHHALIAMHNFSAEPRAPRLSARDAGDRRLVDLLARNDSRADEHGTHVVPLPPYGYRWYRPGGIDHRIGV